MSKSGPLFSARGDSSSMTDAGLLPDGGYLDFRG